MGQLRLRLFERDAIIAIVDTGNDVAGGDMLVIGHRHRGDVARHLRLKRKLPRRDEGIVRQFEMPGVVPIEVTARRRERADT